MSSQTSDRFLRPTTSISRKRTRTGSTSTEVKRQKFEGESSIETGGESSDSSVAEERRKELQTLKDKGKSRCLVPTDEDLKEHLPIKMPLDGQKIELKVDESIKSRLKESFEAIPKGCARKEKVLQVPFYNFLKLLFDDTNLQVHDTQLMQMNKIGLLTSSLLPDLTITPKEQNYAEFAILYVQLKPFLEKDKGLKYLEAFKDLQGYAEHAFFKLQIIPRNEVYGLSSDGLDYHFYKFFMNSDGALKYIEFTFEYSIALDVLIKIAHGCEFKNFQMQFEKPDGPTLDLMIPTYLKSLKLVHQTKISGVYKGLNFVIKINGRPKYKKNIDQEKTIYEELAKKRVEVKVDFPLLTLEAHYNSTERSAVRFKEIGTDLKNITGMHQTVLTLKYLHELGYVHRDVRPSNFLVIEHNKVVLIDFGFSVKSADGAVNFSGSLVTASNEVLRKLKFSEEIQVTPQDDCESLVKSVILLYYNKEMYWEALRNYGNLDIPKAAEKLLMLWEFILTRPNVKKVFDELLMAAKLTHYDELELKMKKLEQEGLDEAEKRTEIKVKWLCPNYEEKDMSILLIKDGLVSDLLQEVNTKVELSPDGSGKLRIFKLYKDENFQILRDEEKLEKDGDIEIHIEEIPKDEVIILSDETLCLVRFYEVKSLKSVFMKFFLMKFKNGEKFAQVKDRVFLKLGIQKEDIAKFHFSIQTSKGLADKNDYIVNIDELKFVIVK